MINKEKIKELSEKLGEPKWLLDWRINIFEQAKNLPKDILKYGLGISSAIPEGLLKNIDQDQVKPEYDYKTKGNTKVLTLENALKDKELSSKIEKLLGSDLPVSTNFYFGLMASFFNNALVVLSGSGSDNEIEMSSKFSGNYFDLILVVVESGAELSVIDKLESASGVGPHLVGRSVIIYSEENSKVFYLNNGNLSEEGYFLSNKISELKDRAEISWLDMNSGSVLIKSDIRNFLRGEESKAVCVNLSKTHGSQLYDFYNASYHLASGTASDMNAVGEAGDKSKIIYRGMLDVGENLKSVSGFQNGKFIISSPEAEVDAIPSLEIRSKDVDTSHAVSISFLGKDELFFPTSRGIKQDDARRMIFDGYIEKALSKIENTHLKKLISGEKLDMLNNKG